MASLHNAAKREYPHRERVDDASGDKVIVPARYYRLKDARQRPHDRYDDMWKRRVDAGQIEPPKAWGTKIWKI